jgi:DNA replication and repair protein RecF
VSLKQFRVAGFRCLAEFGFAPDPALNLIAGPNASGKTSLLEAIFYIGRGRSFRASGNRELIQSGQKGFTLYGEIQNGEVIHRAGVEVEAGQRRIRIDGEAGTSAGLAGFLPVQAIDPEIHNLVQGGPEFRRQFLDWGVFHVKHSFLDAWRRYQKALKQRNAALRQHEPESSIRAWDGEFIAAGGEVDQLRKEYMHGYLQLLDSIISKNLPFDSKCSYYQGWAGDDTLAEALQLSWSRDQALGATQVGPHRADLKLVVQERRARYRVSRGQQKLLAATLVIAQIRFVAAQGCKDMVLLVDDPAAELDPENRQRLFDLLQDMPAQMFITALDPNDLPWREQGMMFHVDQGKITSLL